MRCSEGGAADSDRKETEMRKVIANEWMTLDGVVQAPSYGDEDTTARWTPRSANTRPRPPNDHHPGAELPDDAGGPAQRAPRPVNLMAGALFLGRLVRPMR
jgi:hypothetical protein